MKNKFSIGDKVRVVGGSSKFIGVTGTISGIELDGDSVWCNDWSDGISGYMSKKNLELIEPKKLIVHCPTKQDFIDVQKKMFNEGYEWMGRKKALINDWDRHREETCIDIMEEDDFKMKYADRYCYQQKYPNIPIISAKQYLNKPVVPTLTSEMLDEAVELNTSAGEEKKVGPFEKYLNYKIALDCFTPKPQSFTPKPQKKKIMSIIKDAFKSEDKKALAQYNIANGDGGLTADGVHEFVHYLWETNKEARKGFIKKVVERYKEDKKK